MALLPRYLRYGTIPTYPRLPNPTLTLNPHVGTNCWLRGEVGRFTDRNRSLRSESSNVITTFFDDSFCRKLDR